MPHLTVPLLGPAGEPVDFLRTINSHGVASLPPITPNGNPATSFRATPRLTDGRIETVAVSSESLATLLIETASDPGLDGRAAIIAAVRHLLRLDQDLSPFYAKAATDPDLAWVTAGAGRMMRCQTVFEDVVKTICTTNCTWSGTVRMVEGIVRHLGELAPDAPERARSEQSERDLPYRAFPTPAAMAEADPRLYKEVARCGYRGAYLQSLARGVVDGELDLEAMGTATPEELRDDELARQLVALPGVGPYAAAHVMTMLGRFSRLVLDSWTRPTYARLVGRDAVPDAEIRGRFAGYGEHAGLAFWMMITRGWLEPGVPPGEG